MSRPQRCGFVSLLYSVGDKPLSLWSKHISLDGRIRRVEDQALRGDKVIEIMGPHQTPVPTNITCPANPMDVLNIKLPILVFVIKNLELMFKLEFQLLDKMMHRRQFSLTTHNPEKSSVAHANAVRVPLKLDEGWNQLEINLQTLCNEVYGTDYQAFQRIIIYPNCRLRRVYFQDKHYEQDETPVELCQAFFDMYMLKWGIHLVERSCQTEEIYTGLSTRIGSNVEHLLSFPRPNLFCYLKSKTSFFISYVSAFNFSFTIMLNILYQGPLQPCDLEYFASESNMSVSVTATSLPLYVDSRINQIKKAMGKNMCVSMTVCNGKTVVLKNNSKSVNQIGKKIETMSHCEFKLSKSERSPSIANCEIKSSNALDKRICEPAKLCEKDRKKSGHKTKKSKIETQFKDKLSGDNKAKSLNFKETNGTVKLFQHVKKSEYLKSQIGENFLNLNSDKNDTDLRGSSHQSGEKIESNHKVNKEKAQTKVSEQLSSKDNIDLKHSDPSSVTSNRECVAKNREECIQHSRAQIDINVKKSKPVLNAPNDMRKVEIYQGDGLLSHSVRAIEEVINEVQKIREELINYDVDKRIPSGVKKDALKDMPCDVPPVVEIQATSSDESSKKALLSTDEAVCDFLELRHAVNQKILEKLKDKGLTITEVELSIYNSKNRRNCYGQGKLIESGIVGTNKASGFSSIEPIKMDVSLKKEQLSLNDKICMQLRNELDAALLQLKSTQVRVTAEVVEDTIGNIVKKDCKGSNSDFFTVREAQYIKKKVCNEKMLKRDTETSPCIEYGKNGKNKIHDFIKNLDKYSGAEIVNVLFQRQMYNSEAEYRSI